MQKRDIPFDYASDGASKANAIDLMAFATKGEQSEYTMMIAPSGTEAQTLSWLMGFYSTLAGRYAVEWLQSKEGTR